MFTFFLPALGTRHFSDGAINNPDTYGYYWSFSHSGGSLGYSLLFGSNETNPAWASNLALGRTIRCVR